MGEHGDSNYDVTLTSGRSAFNCSVQLNVSTKSLLTIDDKVESNRVAFFNMGMGTLSVEMYKWRCRILDEMLLRGRSREGRK